MKNTNFYEEIINGDWLGRSADDYIYKRLGLSIGWQATLTEGEPASNFIIRVAPDSVMDSGRKLAIAKQACELIKSRMILNTEENPTLEPLSTTDSMLTMPTFNHALDPILGYMVHEMAHILYTSDEYHDHLLSQKQAEQNLKGMIMNVIEDERIESNVAKFFGGYVPYLGKAKDYCFGKKREAELEKLKEINLGNTELQIRELTPIEKLANAFISMVRYPKSLEEEEVLEFENELRDIKEILNDYPTTIAELIEASEAIYLVFARFFDEQDNNDDQGEQDNDQGEQENGDDEDNDQGDGDGQDTEADAETGGGNKKSNKGNNGKKDGKEKGNKQKDDGAKQKDQGNEKGDNGDDASSGKGQGKPVELTPELAEALEKALANMVEAIENASPTPNEDITDSDVEAIVGKFPYWGDSMLKELEEMGLRDIKEYTTSSHTFPALARLNSDEILVKTIKASEYKHKNYYEEAEKNVSTYASMLRAKLIELNRNHTVVNRGLYEGDFDDDLLTDALIGAKNVYSETFQVTNPGATIGLLVDESGSMDSFGRFRRAMEIAVMFEKALRGVNNIEFYCYGHTTAPYGKKIVENGSTLLNVYYEGRKKGNFKDLGLISADNGNRDGHALVETVARIRQEEKDMKKPIILFMISDGEPSASTPSRFNGNQVEYLKDCVDTVERTMNTQVIHVAIESNIPSEKMYNSYVKMTDYSTLVKDLGNLLRKIVTKQQSNTISI